MKRRWLSIFLAALILLGAVGCTNTPAGDSETTLPPETTAPVQKTLVLAEDVGTDYVVLRAETGSDAEVDQAIRVRKAIAEAIGVDLDMGTDWVRSAADIPAAAHEIVVGRTNRPQSVAALENDLLPRDWGIYFTDGRVTIIGGTDEATEDAVDYFLESLLDAEGKKLELEEGFAYIHRHVYPLGEITLNGVPLKEYTVVIPAAPNVFEENAAHALCDYLLAQGGFTLPVIRDSEPRAEHELLIGATSRPESKKYDGLKYGEMEYLLTAEGNHAVLRGEGYLVGGAVGALAALIRPEKAGDATAAQLSTAGKPEKFIFADKAKNMILLIGDGMGYNQIELALSEGMEFFIPRLFPNQGEAKTYSASSSITDSAASGTALSSGYKTNNRYLGMNPRGEKMPNIREVAHDAGARTAVITTDALTGATPAAFTAHVKDRDMSDEIKAQQEAIEIEYLAGKVGNGIVDETRAALRTIANGDSDSFFIMVEEAYIDKHAHSNAGDDVVRTVKLLNDIAAYLSQFVFLHPDTALIVTADHECGGIKQKADGTFYFTSDNHTGVNVPVSAVGAGTEFFNEKTVENVEIARFMGRAWGVEKLGA